MKVGDLIKLRDGEAPRRSRDFGTVLAFDAYYGSRGLEPMAQVLWNTGKTGWILTSRINVVNEEAIGI